MSVKIIHTKIYENMIGNYKWDPFALSFKTQTVLIQNISTSNTLKNQDWTKALLVVPNTIYHQIL